MSNCFSADELLKLKQLLDDGVLTQEEFDVQKKRLIGPPAQMQRPVGPIRVCAHCYLQYSASENQCPRCRTLANYIPPSQNIPLRGKVNKIAYGLTGIFVGGLGVHKFLAGKVGMGILYILFCWTLIPSLIGLIEGIIALTTPEDGQGNIYV
jgi:TM2 domain-containing membrane protein YozV